MDSRKTAVAGLVALAVLLVLLGRTYFKQEDAQVIDPAADSAQWRSKGVASNKKENIFGCPSAFHGKHCLFDGLLYSVDGSSSESASPRAALLPIPEDNGIEAHGSNLLMLPSGDILLCWFSGREGSSAVSIVVSKLAKGESQWSAPKIVSVEDGRSAQNPVMVYIPATKAILLLHTSQLAGQGQGTSEVRQVWSYDLGSTWSTPKAAFEEGADGAFTRNQFLWSKDGNTLLLPMYYTPNGFNDMATHYCTMRMSTDNGASFPKEQEIQMTNPSDYLAQPTVVRIPKHKPCGGCLRAFFRDRQATSIYTATSEDDGYTWSRPEETQLDNNNSGIQAAVLTSGAIAIVFNNVSGGVRIPLTIGLSYDGGTTWPFIRNLDIRNAEKNSKFYNLDGYRERYSYPSIVQDDAEVIHISYTFYRATIKYVQVTEDWIKGN